ncbi:NTP transferase domain-containing protein [Allokutzneria sp. A3M-2-11 16]|uniref:molybdenum cofactor guanylyltransferase n=1 Tax=Allokutzneria sp. A3M-2-11 16 TaxID=2962043 RepID=UPI0020B8CF39|nr:NTP transferase domain-containing protein [Allokutzneria sp. A3M-2-11 16]MCP3802205.1 NTP transferase domain-containing protein [Allokutzneria sp. A3M-2-11 16]
MELIVLAGGEGSRLGGRDKAALVLGGRTLLERVLGLVAPDSRVIVVGPRRETTRPVVWTREDPPGGGPVAGLAAGVARVVDDVVAVLAVDQPGVTASTLTRLRAALSEDVDGVVLVDAEDRPQWMVGVWRTAALSRCLPETPAGSSLRRVLGGLTVRRLPAEDAEADDIDTPADLGRWRDRAE